MSSKVKECLTIPVSKACILSDNPTLDDNVAIYPHGASVYLWQSDQTYNGSFSMTMYGTTGITPDHWLYLYLHFI